MGNRPNWVLLFFAFVLLFGAYLGFKNNGEVPSFMVMILILAIIAYYFRAEIMKYLKSNSKSIKINTESEHKKDNILFKKCPVCKRGRVLTAVNSSLFGLIKFEVNKCEKCNAEFKETETDELSNKYYRLNLSESNEQNKYSGEVLAYREWEKGISDLDYVLKQGKLPIIKNTEEQAILPKSKEKFHWVSSAKLFEERAVRNTNYVGTRIGRVYLGGSQGVSHGEARHIDNGALYLTNKRVLFHGNFRDIVYPLNKITAIQEESDGIVLSCETRQKVQKYVLREPKKWVTYIKLAMKLNN